MSYYCESLTLFDRINLAQCARQRAESAWMDDARFKGEYDTARLWMKYQILSLPGCRIVEPD